MKCGRGGGAWCGRRGIPRHGCIDDSCRVAGARASERDRRRRWRRHLRHRRRIRSSATVAILLRLGERPTRRGSRGPRRFPSTMLVASLWFCGVFIWWRRETQKSQIVAEFACACTVCAKKRAFWKFCCGFSSHKAIIVPAPNPLGNLIVKLLLPVSCGEKYVTLLRISVQSD